MELWKFSLGYIPNGIAPKLFGLELALKRLLLFFDAFALKGVRKSFQSLKARVPLRACVYALKGGVCG